MDNHAGVWHGVIDAEQVAVFWRARLCSISNSDMEDVAVVADVVEHVGGALSI